ncbi:MAG: hypothetical protein HY649_09385 [Acidobacteria bacterium]|nr:hypothetical protein [Acidobacteriota bacterium]
MDVTWRDHFRGAMSLGLEGRTGSVHISRVYRGRSDNLYKFAISAPILDGQKNFVDVIATSVATDATMALVDLHDDRREVVLIGPRDVDGPETDRTTELGYAVLFHPAHRRGADPAEFSDQGKILARWNTQTGSPLESPSSMMVIAPNDVYWDPVSSVAPDYAGRWIAGFAPVGNTGFVVIVQQCFDDAVTLESSTFLRLALYSALVSLVAVVILVMALWQWARGRKLETVLQLRPADMG